MKKLYILIVLLLFGAGLRAQQTNLTEAVDFTVTDCHGQTYNLFEILDRGQAVFIDFFFYTCGQCQTISPYITNSYIEMGCNMHDVFYMEISYIDSDALCQQWVDEHDVEFPTVGKDGGGNEVFDLYGIIGCPTLVLIMPDRSIPIQGLLQLYPFSAQDIVSAMQRYGLQPHDCTGTDVEESDATVNLFPNPVNDFFTLTGADFQNITVFNALGQKVDEWVGDDREVRISTALYPNGLYFVRVNGEETRRFVVAH